MPSALLRNVMACHPACLPAAVDQLPRQADRLLDQLGQDLGGKRLAEKIAPLLAVPTADDVGNLAGGKEHHRHFRQGLVPLDLLTDSKPLRPWRLTSAMIRSGRNTGAASNAASAVRQQ